MTTAISAEATKKKEDAVAARIVVTQINTQVTNGTKVTRDNYTSTSYTVTARYNALNAEAKAMVGNAAVLEKQLALIEQYKGEVTAYADAVKAAIITKGEVNTVKATEADIDAAKKNVSDLEAIETALSGLQKDQDEFTGAKVKVTTYEENIALAETALKAIEAIDAIPATVQARDKLTIADARTAYDAVVTAGAVELVGTAAKAKLEAAEVRIAQIQADAAAVEKDVLAVMNAINAKNTLTAEDKAAVDNAIAVYDAWYATGTPLANKVTEELTAAKAVLDEKSAQVDDLAAKANAAAAKAIADQIAALPAADKVTSSDKAAYDAVAKAYEDAEDIQNLIDNIEVDNAGTTASKKLEAVKLALKSALEADLKAAVKEQISQLTTAGDLNDKAKYDAIDSLLATDLSAYDGSKSYTVEGLLGQDDTATFAYYNKAKEAYDANVEAAADQNGQNTAKAVIDLINQIPTLKADGTDTDADITAAEAAIKAAKDAYAKLDADGKAHVTNYDAIAAAEAKVATAKVYPLAKDIKTIYGYDLDNLTEEQVKVIEDTYAAYNGLSAADKTLINDLTTAPERTNLTNAKAKADAYRNNQEEAVAALKDKVVNDVKDADITAMTLADRAKYTEIINAYEALGEQAKADFAKTDAYAIYQKLVAKYDSFDLEKGEITVANTVYTGEAQQVAVTVKDAAGNTVAASMYKVTYRDNTDVGTATVRVKGDDVNYTGTKSATFEITAASLEDATVSGITTKTYTGKAMTQAGLKVALNGVLIDEENYTVAYKNNAKVGKASVTITGTKNCTGTITKTFVVKPGKATVTSLKAGKKKATVKIKEIPGATTYKIAYKQRGNSYKYKTVKTTSLSKTITGLKSGKVYKVKVLAFTKVDGKTYYTGYSTIKTVKVK